MTISSTQAWVPQDATIKLEKKGSGSVQTITTDVTNFSDGGGDKDIEQIAHFGGAYLVFRKPQEPFEVEFQMDPRDTKWMAMISGDVSTSGGYQAVRSGGAQGMFKIKVEWKNPDNTEALKFLYYNAYGVSYQKDNAADGRLTGTIRFKLAPTDVNGSFQRIEMETSDDTSAGIGSSLTGSFGSWEKVYDILHGYSPGSML
jgi:hypothetical protein